MRRAIVVPIGKALGCLACLAAGEYESWLPEGLPATQLMCATALVLHCMRPSSTQGSVAASRLLLLEGQKGTACCPCWRGPPARSCLATCTGSDGILSLVGRIAVSGAMDQLAKPLVLASSHSGLADWLTGAWLLCPWQAGTLDTQIACASQ